MRDQILKYNAKCTLEAMTYSADKWKDESSTNACPEVTYWQNEAGRNSFQCRVVRQWEMCLSHTDRQLVIALPYTHTQHLWRRQWCHQTESNCSVTDCYTWPAEWLVHPTCSLRTASNHLNGKNLKLPSIFIMCRPNYVFTTKATVALEA